MSFEFIQDFSDAAGAVARTRALDRETITYSMGGAFFLPQTEQNQSSGSESLKRGRRKLTVEVRRRQEESRWLDGGLADTLPLFLVVVEQEQRRSGSSLFSFLFFWQKVRALWVVLYLWIPVASV
jgi:hypothetical protein